MHYRNIGEHLPRSHGTGSMKILDRPAYVLLDFNADGLNSLTRKKIIGHVQFNKDRVMIA